MVLLAGVYFSEPIFSGFADAGTTKGREAGKYPGYGEDRGRLDSQLDSATDGADRVSCKCRSRSMAVRTGCMPRCKYRSR